MVTRADILLEFTRPPRVLYLYCDFTFDKKHKYLVLLSKDHTEVSFFLINSRSYRVSQRSEIRITSADFPYLHHDSYIDCNKLFTCSVEEFSGMIARNSSNFDKGDVPKPIIEKLIQTIEDSEVLSEREKMKILPTLKASISDNL